MEAALFMLDCLAMAWLCIKVVGAESRRGSGPEALGWFAYEKRDSEPLRPRRD